MLKQSDLPMLSLSQKQTKNKHRLSRNSMIALIEPNKVHLIFEYYGFHVQT